MWERSGTKPSPVWYGTWTGSFLVPARVAFSKLPVVLTVIAVVATASAVEYTG